MPGPRGEGTRPDARLPVRDRSSEAKEVLWPSASVARRCSTATSITTQKSRVSRSHDGRGTIAAVQVAMKKALSAP
jgi:hypothetical protein